MKVLHLSRGDIKTQRAAFVMGIVNAAPDSFWEGSRGGVRRAMQLAEEGADILDIGGESTRPGAFYVDEAEEMKRVIPVVKAIRRECNIPISIDTRKSAVFKAALDEGADILNDVSAMEDDKSMASLAAKSGASVILMHKRGIPAIMQEDTKYKDVFSEVNGYLLNRARWAEEKGIAREKIIVDPGVGFGKDTAANIELIARCKELCAGKYSVLVGLSRKSVIGDITERSVGDRLFGSIAANCVAAMSGAAIIRVHDVKESADAMTVVAAIMEQKGEHENI